jgi:hypothetical protein
LRENWSSLRGCKGVGRWEPHVISHVICVAGKVIWVCADSSLYFKITLSVTLEEIIILTWQQKALFQHSSYIIILSHLWKNVLTFVCIINCNQLIITVSMRYSILSFKYFVPQL